MKTLNRLLLALAPCLAVAVAFAEPDPEPMSATKGEAAVPAIDLKEAKTNRELATKAAVNLALSKKNLSRIGIAVHEYFDAMRLLPADITDKGGKPLLSWRVALLPYIGEGALYKEFKFDEAWDSPHNKKLLAKMPEVYRSPRVKVKGMGLTVYQAFTGPNAVFGSGKRLGLVSIRDGTSYTICAVESSVALPWTKPADLAFDRKKALPDIGKAYGKRPLAVMFDGSPRLLDLEKIKPETLKNAIDPADGNVLGMDWKEGAEG